MLGVPIIFSVVYKSCCDRDDPYQTPDLILMCVFILFKRR